MEKAGRRKVIGHCTLHTLVSALPSFLLAVIAGFNSPYQIFGMLSGIAVFLLIAIAVHLSAVMRFLTRDSLRASSIALGKKFRFYYALIMIPGYFVPVLSLM